MLAITLFSLFLALATASPVLQPLIQRTNTLISRQANNTCVDGRVVTLTVVRGDTLSKLSDEFKSGICNIVKLNNITNPDLISLDQVLKVPTKVCKPDSASCLKSQNPKGGSQTCLKSGSPTRAIKQGDTFIGIAQELDLNVDALQAANPGVDKFNLRVGSTINIPICK